MNPMNQNHVPVRCRIMCWKSRLYNKFDIEDNQSSYVMATLATSACIASLGFIISLALKTLIVLVLWQHWQHQYCKSRLYKTF